MILKVSLRNLEITEIPHLDTDDLVSGSTEDWAKYQTKEQNNIFSTIRGHSSDYDGSGYVYDFAETAT